MSDETQKPNENSRRDQNSGDGNRRDNDRRSERGDGGRRGNDQQNGESKSTAPSGWRALGSVRTWLANRRTKNPNKEGARFNFNLPGVPDHWTENVIEFVVRTSFMTLLTVYPLALVYIAAVGFMPRSASVQNLWGDVAAFIVSLAINGAYFTLKRRDRTAAVPQAHVYIVLSIKTVMLVLGLIYTAFQHGWINPVPFEMPPLDEMLFNPVFLGVLTLMLADTLSPGFFRKPLMYDDEKVVPADKK